MKTGGSKASDSERYEKSKNYIEGDFCRTISNNAWIIYRYGWVDAGVKRKLNIPLLRRKDGPTRSSCGSVALL